MARKNDDNFYRRQQDEANRLAATQNRHLNEIAKLAKSSVEEMRKMRRAFEAFSEAMLGMKIEPFQGAVLSEAARGQIAEFDINGFKETLLKGEAPTVPGDNSHEAAKMEAKRAAAARAQGWPVASSRGSEAMSEQLYPSPSREARLERRRSRAEKRRYRVDYDLAYDGGGSEWSGYYRTRAGAKVAAWWNVHVSSWGGTAVLEGEER